VLTFTAPTGGVTSGTPLLINDTFVIPSVTATVGVVFEGWVTGVFILPKATGVAWLEGQRLYFDPANVVCSTVPTVGPCIGVATRNPDNTVAGSSATTGYVKVNPQVADGAGVMARQARFRVPLASVNAGATLLPAIPGKGY